MKINANKGTFDIAKFFNGQLPGKVLLARNQWQQEAPQKIIRNIKDTIQRGNSPVTGFGRYVAYSPTYKSAILAGRYSQYSKKLRPVNLTLTGKMMRSLIHRRTQKGFTIYFTSKLARIHSQLGAGKSKTIRKVMPSGSERFKESVIFESNETIRKALLDQLANIF